MKGGPDARDAHVDVSGETSAGRGIITSLRAHPFVSAFVALLTVLVALAWSSTREPTYEASAQVLVTPIPEFSSTLTQLPLPRSSSDRTRVIQTAANLFDSPAAAELTADRLGSGWTADRVSAMVDVLPEGESDVMSVTARADDAELATRVANEFAASGIEARANAVRPVVASAIADIERRLSAEEPSSALAAELTEELARLQAIQAAGDPTVSLSRQAEVPTAPGGPSRLMLALLAVVLGLAAGVGMALLIDMLGKPTVANPAHAVAVTGLPVLARVPGLSRWQRARKSSKPRFRPAAVAALRKMQHQLGGRRRLLFVGCSAGDGVTTSVAELAFTLARAGHDVLALDLDTQRPALAARLRAPEPPALASVLGAGEPWTAGIVPVPGVPGLKLGAVGAHGALGLPDHAGPALAEILETARDRFDYVLLDAPSLAESGEALRLASVTDAVILVVRVGSTRVQDVETAVDLLERVDGRPDGLLLIGGRVSAPSADPAAVPAQAEPTPGAAPVRHSVEA